MKFKHIVCVLCGSSESDRESRSVIHYMIDDEAHCGHCIAKMIKDTKTNNKQNITGLSGQELKESDGMKILYGDSYEGWIIGSLVSKRE